MKVGFSIPASVMRTAFLLLSLALSATMAAATPTPPALGSAEAGVTALNDNTNPRLRAYLAQALHFMEQGDYVAAKKKLELVLQEQPTHAKALSLMETCQREVNNQQARERHEF